MTIYVVLVLLGARQVEATWTTLDPSGAVHTITAHGIDGDRIVGQYYDGSAQHGFVYVIPEPATLLLLSLGGVVLRRKH